MFKKIIPVLALMLVGLLNLNADDFTKSATIKPQLVQKGSKKEWCPVCAMSIEKYYKTSHTSKINNTDDKQYCSMRCLVVDMQEHHIKPEDIKVVDVQTQKLIPVKDAFYVVGSDVRGTMSKVSKLAFSTPQAADDFSMQNGGEVVDFSTALKMAQDSLAFDVEMIEKKKSKQVYPMGKKIFEKKCNNNIDINNYTQINELKADLKDKELCGKLKENELQPLSLYMWEVKRLGDVKNSLDVIHVTKDEKCPVCGMFVYKYPKWAAQIFYKDIHYSFDGVKDMMKYYFAHKDGITKMSVTDYYSQKAMDATKAYFVTGSDIYGPMGTELIPFSSLSEAKTFSMDHKGIKILRFDEITNDEITKLDE